MDVATIRAGLRAREEFLCSGEISGIVRPSTARSWLRSRAAGLAPDRPLNLRYAGEVEQDSALLRAARPVADRLFAGDMQGLDVAMFVTDDAARIIGRWVGDRGLLSHLDAVGSVPGFVFEESRAGTSALGTPLEEGEPVLVLGHEHYADCLRGLSAVGVPIVHPASGRIEGVVDLVCRADRYSPMMMALVTHVAREIGDRLLTGFGAQDRALLEAYLLADRRGPRRAIVAVNSRLVIANPRAGEVLGPVDQGLLWDLVERALAARESVLVLGGDAESAAVQASVAEIRRGGARAGAILQLRRHQDRRGTRSASNSRDATTLSTLLPGPSRRWQSVLQRTSSIVSLGHRLLLTGPPGVGKRTLALSACALHHPDKNVHEYDAADAGEPGWLEDLCSASKDDDSVVLVTHLDLLDTVTLHRFCRWVDQSSGAGLLLATSTVDGDRRPPAVLTGQFPHLLELPPLADRVEDIAPIAEKIARGDKGDAAVRIDAAAIRRLTGADWRANVRQLEQAVRAARSACPGSVVRVEDLPELCFLPRSKTNLTRLQRHERDMIIATLAAEGGNKKAAAASLGISRSTLYRKLVAFGLGG